MRTYPADEVDSLLKDAWQLAEDSLAVAKQAQDDATQLRADKVVLEKIAAAAEEKSCKSASATPSLDPKAVDACLDQLQDLALLDPKGREKIASALIADPSNALELVLRVATLSQPAPAQGAGLSKSASKGGAPAGSQVDPDGWGNIVTLGA